MRQCAFLTDAIPRDTVICQDNNLNRFDASEVAMSAFSNRLLKTTACVLIGLTFVCCGPDGSPPTPLEPVAPINLSATKVAANQIDLQWEDASTNESGFRIEQKISGGEYAEIGDVGADSTSFSATELALDTMFFFRVRAYNDNGSSAYTNEASEDTVRPYILVIIDTSGSMNSTMSGQTKLHTAKDGLSDAISTENRAVFALQRFGQVCTGGCSCTASGGGCDGATWSWDWQTTTRRTCCYG
jgi:hypothetical protein